MAQEFCSKMAALGEEPRDFPFAGDRHVTGYSIPLARGDEEGPADAERLFIGVDGYFAPFEGDRVSTPPADVMLREEVAETYRQSMLDALLGETTATGRLPDE